MVGLGGLEPPTSRLSVVRSSRLSYRPLSILSEDSVPSKLNNVRNLLKADLGCYSNLVGHRVLHRKEVIQPLVLERLPCYDFTPITKPTFGRAPLAVRLRTSGVPGSHGVTGGVYKARERIHRGMLIRDY